MTATRSLLVTGATSGLGLELVRRFATRKDWQFVILVRSAERAEALKALLNRTDIRDRVYFVVCDQANLSAVGRAGRAIADLVDHGVIPPFSSIVLNAATMRKDARQVGTDGFELTLTTNLLAPHLLLAMLSPHLATHARIMIVGSNVIREAWWHRITGVRPPRWRSLYEQCSPADDGAEAYACSKLGLFYLSVALDQLAPDAISSMYFDPGVMPGTNILRERTRASQIYWRKILPHIAWTFGGVTVARAAKTLCPYALHDVPLTGWSHVRVRSIARARATQKSDDVDTGADRVLDYFCQANAICGVPTASAAPWWSQTDQIRH